MSRAIPIPKLMTNAHRPSLELPRPQGNYLPASEHIPYVQVLRSLLYQIRKCPSRTTSHHRHVLTLLLDQRRSFNLELYKYFTLLLHQRRYLPRVHMFNINHLRIFSGHNNFIFCSEYLIPYEPLNTVALTSSYMLCLPQLSLSLKFMTRSFGVYARTQHA